MIDFPETARHVIRAMTGYGPMRVAAKVNDKVVDKMQIELVYIDGDGNIVGDEANDYKPKDGEYPCLAFSAGYFRTNGGKDDNGQNKATKATQRRRKQSDKVLRIIAVHRLASRLDTMSEEDARDIAKGLGVSTRTVYRDWGVLSRAYIQLGGRELDPK